jgi:ClpP class serine protease
MSLAIAQLKLRDALKDLRLRVARARESWDDAAAREFEAEVIDPLDAKINQAVDAAGKMAQLLSAAKRDSGADGPG